MARGGMCRADSFEAGAGRADPFAAPGLGHGGAPLEVGVETVLAAWPVKASLFVAMPL